MAESALLADHVGVAARFGATSHAPANSSQVSAVHRPTRSSFTVDARCRSEPASPASVQTVRSVGSAVRARRATLSAFAAILLSDCGLVVLRVLTIFIFGEHRQPAVTRPRSVVACSRPTRHHDAWSARCQRTGWFYEGSSLVARSVSIRPAPRKWLPTSPATNHHLANRSDSSPNTTTGPFTTACAHGDTASSHSAKLAVHRQHHRRRAPPTRHHPAPPFRVHILPPPTVGAGRVLA